MAITSFPFDGQDTTEDDYGRLFRELVNSGVASDIASTGFKVTAAVSGLSVDVAAGFAVVRGCAVRSTATEAVAVTAPGSGTTNHIIALKLDPSANSITLALVSGTAGASTDPSLSTHPTTNETGVFHLPLARVTVAAGASSLSAANVTDLRRSTARGIDSHSGTATRPAYPRAGQVSFDTAKGAWEGWTGSAWGPLDSWLPGTILMYGGSAIPAGWLACDGTSYSTSTYSALHSAIGYAYGGSGGSFQTPNMSVRVPRHTTPGAIGGASSVWLDITNIPDHTHTINHTHATTSASPTHDHVFRTSPTDGSNALTARMGTWGDSSYAGDMSDSPTHTHTVPAYTGNSGGRSGGPFAPLNIENAWVGVRYIIKT